jgi:hypothetical protein
MDWRRALTLWYPRRFEGEAPAVPETVGWVAKVAGYSVAFYVLQDAYRFVMGELVRPLWSLVARIVTGSP